MQLTKHVSEVEGHPQAELLESLSDRIVQNLPIAEWQQLLEAARQTPIQVQHVRATVVSLQSPAWNSVSELKADVALLSQSKGGHLDPCPANGALVLLRDADDAFALAMELRELVPGVQIHVGMATGTCEVATLRTSARKLRVVVGSVADEAIATCRMAPAGTMRMSPSTFESLQHHASWLHSCMLQTEYEGEEIAAISVTPPPVKGGGQLSTFAGLGLM